MSRGRAAGGRGWCGWATARWIAAAKARLLARLPRLGYAVTADPGLSLCADGVFLAADWYGPACRVTLPAGARRLTLHSRTARPADLDPASADTRMLGVPLLRVQLDGCDTPLTNPRFGAGWLDAEDGLRWTTGAAAMDVQGVRRVELRFGDWLRYVAATAGLTPALAQG